MGVCEGCDERALPLIMKKRNASLDELNELKKVLGHTDKFVTDDDDDISPSGDQPTQSNDDASGNSADVVSLDTFRKRPTK